MTRDQLNAAVPVYTRDGEPYFIVMADIPPPWRGQFAAALRGGQCPVIEGQGACAYVWDWQRWLSSSASGVGPQGLD